MRRKLLEGPLSLSANQICKFNPITDYFNIHSVIVMTTCCQIGGFTHSGGTCMMSPVKAFSFSSMSDLVMCSVGWNHINHKSSCNIERRSTERQTGTHIRLLNVMKCSFLIQYLPKSFSSVTVPVASRVSVAFPSSPTATYFWKTKFY